MFKSKKIFSKNKNLLFANEKPTKEEAHIYNLQETTNKIVDVLNSSYSHPIERRNAALSLSKMLVHRYMAPTDKDNYIELCNVINRLAMDTPPDLPDNTANSQKAEDEEAIFHMEIK